MKKTDKFAYSFDGENFDDICDSVEEALHDARIQASCFDEPIETVYIGEVWDFEPKVDADSVIERVQDDAEDEAGECADDYLEGVKIADRQKLQEMLTETFKQWAAETFNEPRFFVVKGITEYSLMDAKPGGDSLDGEKNK